MMLLFAVGFPYLFATATVMVLIFVRVTSMDCGVGINRGVAAHGPDRVSYSVVFSVGHWVVNPLQCLSCSRKRDNDMLRAM